MLNDSCKRQLYDRYACAPFCYIVRMRTGPRLVDILMRTQVSILFDILLSLISISTDSGYC